MNRILKYLKGRKGITLVWMALMLAVLLMLAGMAIDIAYMYYVKNQLQVAADAAALAGAAELSGDPNDKNQSPARSEAVNFANKNSAAGSAVVLADGGAGNNTLSDTNDITVGHWDGAMYTADTIPVNAVEVRARRTSGSPGGQVGVFIGQIFSLIGADWSAMSAAASAIAAPGSSNLLPVVVNEYWEGDNPLGGGPCGNPASPDPGRIPYGIYHVYPDSFVRPPCTTPGASNCILPTNGNVAAFPPFSCTGSSVTVLDNGPLTSPCSGTDCTGRPTSTSGRVFAIIGGNARGNAPAFNIFGLLDLDDRIGISTTGGQWYNVVGDNFIAQSPNKPAITLKSVATAYIDSEIYPNTIPTSVVELFQPMPNYPNLMNPYTSSQPYASTSYFTGQGATGQVVNDNFYDSGNYSGGKYAPGNKIIVAVYDGVVGDTGTQARTTIVGFTTITIFGYGNRLTSSLGVSGPQNTLYGYVANINDSLKQNPRDLPDFEIIPKLVK
jgi:Flp pilus assembly protein TadG